MGEGHRSHITIVLLDLTIQDIRLNCGILVIFSDISLHSFVEQRTN